MQLFRTLCVVAVLGALTYGAYVTLTSSPPVEPPLDAVNWDSPPRVELPSGNTAATPPKPAEPPKPAPPPTEAAPKFAAAPKPEAAPAATASEPKPTAPGATITGIRPQEYPVAATPDRYPSTNVPPGPFDGVGIAPLASTIPPPVAPPLTSVTPATAVAPNAGPSGASMIPSVAGPTTAGVTPSASAAGRLAEVQALLNQNQLALALTKLSESFDDPTLSPDDDRRVTELLDQLAGSVIYSRDHLLLPAHTVQPGERLDQIAARYQTSWELLAKINGVIDPWNLQPGLQLKVIPGPFDALVDKSRRRLTVFLDGMYAGSFPVGFGRDRPAVDGTYTIGGKTPNPAYVGPDLQLPADDPHNPLGERLLDLGNGQAIHGTSEPANLASDDARGCIRLSAHDIEDVYDILTPGSQVIVRP